MNDWKGCGRKRRCLIRDIILAFAWRNWGKPSKTLFRIAGLLFEIWPEHEVRVLSTEPVTLVLQYLLFTWCKGCDAHYEVSPNSSSHSSSQVRQATESLRYNHNICSGVIYGIWWTELLWERGCTFSYSSVDCCVVIRELLDSISDIISVF
jgi:hypothetical protein